jgi:hypothetical protein
MFIKSTTSALQKNQTARVRRRKRKAGILQRNWAEIPAAPPEMKAGILQKKWSWQEGLKGAKDGILATAAKPVPSKRLTLNRPEMRRRRKYHRKPSKHFRQKKSKMIREFRKTKSGWRKNRKSYRTTIFRRWIRRRNSRRSRVRLNRGRSRGTNVINLFMSVIWGFPC